jgi:isoquinoline 1-oxidoreductase beta subunit
VDDALEAATTIVDNTYSFPFVSHATLEPHNCTADFRAGEMWIPRTDPDATSALALVARVTGLPADKVHVDFTRIGGGFGRRLLYDYAAEAR